MTRSRRRFEDTDKLAIVRRHLIDQVPVSDLCDELNLQPTQIYTWQKLLFDYGASAFAASRGKSKQKKDDKKERQIKSLLATIQQRNEVVAELLQEHVQLKKQLTDR